MAILLIGPLLIVSGGVPSLGVHSPATIGLTPSPCTGQTVAPGAAAVYPITITNNGPTATVSPINLTLSNSDAVNFSSTIHDSGGSPITQVALDADAATTVNLRVTASASAPYLASTTTTFTATRSDDPTVTSSLNCVTSVPEGSAVAMTKTVDDTTPTVGQLVTYQVGWDNPGPQTVTGFVVTDTVDADLTFVSAGGGGVYNAGTRTITWTIGDLVAPVTGTVTFTATVDEVPNQTVIGNTAFGDGTNVARGSAARSVTVQAPAMNIVKSVSASTARPGDRLTYTIGYRNTGAENLTNAVVTDIIDSSLTVDTSTITSPGSLSGGTITWSLGTIAAGGATQTVSFEATVNVVPDGTTVTNSATVDGDAMAPATSNVVSTTINSEADLGVTKSVTPSPATAGGQAVFRIIVTNNGPNGNAGFQVSDTLPVQFGSINAPGCSVVGQAVTCLSGGIANGASQTFTVTATASSSVPHGTVVTNTATVATTSTTDPSAANNSASVPVTIQASADLSVLKTASPDPVTAGQQLTYTVTVTNQGPSDNAGFTLTDPLPSGVSFGSASAGCSQSGGTVTCTSSGLANGSSAVFTITGTVAASVPNGTTVTNTASIASNATSDPDASDNSDDVVVTVRAIADLSIVKTDSPDPVIAGTTLTYSVTITNAAGPSNNAGFTVADPLPLGTTFDSASAGCSYSIITDTVTCSSSGLAVGASQSFVVTVDVSPLLLPGSTITNTATIATNATTDQNASNNSSTTTTTVNTSADLALVKSDSPNPVIAGTNLTYSVTVTNTGPSANAGYTVSDPLPSSVSFLSASAGCAFATGTVTCTSSGLGLGASQSYQIVVTVDPSYPDGGTIVNTASIAATSTTDPNPLNDSSAETTLVDTSADLTVTKTDSPDPVIAGENLTYTIVVSDAGPSDNAGFSVADVLPSGTSFVSASAGCSALGPVVTCTSSGLAAGGSVTYTVTVLVDSAVPDGSTITNTATISANSTTDPDATDDFDTTTTDVVAEADLQIVKLDTPDPVEPVQELTYSIEVTNLGSSDNTGFAVEDQIPADTTFVTATVGDCSESGGLVTCMSSGLPAGQTATWTVVVSVDAGVPDGDVLSNTAEIVTTLTTDPNSGNDSSTATTTVSAPTLGVSKTATPASGSDVSPGQFMSFTIIVDNSGSASATGLVVTDTVDALLGGVVPDSGGTFDPATRVITWNLANLAPGATTTVGFTSRVGSASSNQTISNQASAIAAQLADPVLSNVTDHNLRLPDVVVSKDADRTEGSQVKAFDTITYTLRIENRNSRGSAFEVLATDDLPSHLNYIPGSTTLDGSGVPDVGGTSALLGSGLSLGTLTPLAVRTITFRVAVDVAAPAGGLLENWAYVNWTANAGPAIGDFHQLRVFRPTAGPSLRQSILVQGPSGTTVFVTVFNEVLGRSFGILPVTGADAALIAILALSGMGAGGSFLMRRFSRREDER